MANSYNGQRALTFTIGLKRKICTNGLILPDSLVRFSFAHSRKALKTEIRFHIANDRAARVQKQFEQYVGGLRECPLPNEKLRPLVLAVLRLRAPAAIKNDASLEEEWTVLLKYVDAVLDKYVNELGCNAYTILNVVTDFASQPPANRLVRRDRHSLQRLAGEWIGSFSRERHRSDFDLEKYLTKLFKTASENDGQQPSESKVDRLVRRHTESWQGRDA